MAEERLMKTAKKDIIAAIGNTPIVKLNKVATHVKAHLYVKCEFMNPGGSVKDRIGIYMIEQAEKEGKLKPGGTIIEATSGNTGLGLAMAAAMKGYKCIFVMADKQSEEKRTALRSTGAQVVICPTNVEPEDPRSYYSVAKRLAEETPNSFYTRQYWNPSNPETHYLSTGPEIWEQCGEELDAFVVALGTGGTVTGCGRYLKEQNKDVQIVGVDPVGSIYYDYFHTGTPGEAHSYYVEGIGEDFMPDTINLDILDDCMQVTDRESFMMARRLIREEGLLVGGSAGSAVAGAIKYAEKLEKEGKLNPDRPHHILIIVPDSFRSYLSKFLDDEWLKDAGLLEREVIPGTIGSLVAERQNELFVVDKNAPMGSVIDMMKTHSISQLPVLDDGKLLGLVSEVKVLNALVRGEATMKSPVGPLADDNDVARVERSTPLTALAEKFAEGKTAVVVDGEKVQAILTKIDLIEHMINEAPPS